MAPSRIHAARRRHFGGKVVVQKRFCDECQQELTEKVGDYFNVTIQQSYMSNRLEMELCEPCTARIAAALPNVVERENWE